MRSLLSRFAASSAVSAFSEEAEAEAEEAEETEAESEEGAFFDSGEPFFPPEEEEEDAESPLRRTTAP
jgi:hypothetical protein